MDEDSPTRIDIEPSPLARARLLIIEGRAMLDRFEASPRDPRVISLAQARFCEASALASAEMAGALITIADAVATRQEQD